MTSAIAPLSNLAIFIDEAAKLVLPSILKAAPRHLRRSIISMETSSDERAPLALFEQLRNQLVQANFVWVIGLTVDSERYRPTLNTILRAAQDPAVGRPNLRIGLLFPYVSVNEFHQWADLANQMPLSVFGLSPQWRGTLLDSNAKLQRFRQLVENCLFTLESRWRQPAPPTFSSLCSKPGTYAVGIETVALADYACQAATMIEARIFSHFVPCWSELAKSSLTKYRVAFSPDHLRRSTGSLPRLSERFTGEVLAAVAGSCRSVAEMVEELERLESSCVSLSIRFQVNQVLC